MKQEKRIKSFTDLKAWQESHSLILEVYKLTKTFPDEEKFGLTSQIRRSAVSITSNIAEGFSRGSYSDKLRFYYISHGSLTELQSQLLIARDIDYVSSKVFDRIAELATTCHKIITGLIKSTKERVANLDS